MQDVGAQLGGVALVLPQKICVVVAVEQHVLLAHLAHLEARLLEDDRQRGMAVGLGGLGATGGRRDRLGDLYWVLINSSEFIWNH